jgi:hypothetical protein
MTVQSSFYFFVLEVKTQYKSVPRACPLYTTTVVLKVSLRIGSVSKITCLYNTLSSSSSLLSFCS